MGYLIKWICFVSGRNSAEVLKMFCFLIIDVGILSYSTVLELKFALLLSDAV